MYLVAVISSRNLLNAIVKKKSPSDPDNAGKGGGGWGVGGGWGGRGVELLFEGGLYQFFF